MNQIAPDILRQLLRYDAETGKLFWRERGPEWFKPGNTSAEIRCAIWNKRYAGREALASVNAAGHLRGAVLDVPVLAHRAAWAIHYGEWPKDQVDHIDGNPAHNRIENMREVNQAQNKSNAGKRPGRNPTSRFIGVQRIRATGKWGAAVVHSRKTHWCGTFDTEHAAAVARDEMAIRVKGTFARLNFPEAHHA